MTTGPCLVFTQITSVKEARLGETEQQEAVAETQASNDYGEARKVGRHSPTQGRAGSESYVRATANQREGVRVQDPGRPE